MPKKKLLNMENGVSAMVTDGEYLYVKSQRDMYKYDTSNMSLVAHNVLKSGAEWGFAVHGNHISFFNHLDFFMMDKDLQFVCAERLGENISSDVLGLMWFDAPNAYVNIRNGWIYELDINTKKVEKYHVLDSSSWSFSGTENFLYAGTVSGWLVEIDKKALKVTRKIQLCKHNVFKVVHEDGFIYTLSRDYSVRVIDVASFEVVHTIKKVRNFVLTEGFIVAKKPPMAWDKRTFQLVGQVGVPLGLKLNDGRVLVSDNQGVYEVI